MTTLDGPLDGVRVVDLSALAPGPYCSMLLADMGAEVILVEQAGRPQGRRDLSRDPNEERRRYSSYALGRGKRSIGLNLKADEAREIFYQLSDEADVVLEGFRPGVVKRLGVDWETLSQRNPGLIYCSLSGFGQTGPYASHVGHDINYIATAGALGMIGDYASGGRPAIPVNIIADFAGGGLMAAFAIVCAIQARERTGEGQYIDLAMSDGSMSLITSALAGYEGAGADMRPARHVLNGASLTTRSMRRRTGAGSRSARWSRTSTPTLPGARVGAVHRRPGHDGSRAARGGPGGVRRCLQAAQRRRVARAAERCRRLRQAGAVAGGSARGSTQPRPRDGCRSRDAGRGHDATGGGCAEAVGTPGRIRAGAPARGQDTEDLLAGWDTTPTRSLRCESARLWHELDRTGCFRDQALVTCAHYD